jgi:hypothetical protein
MRPERGEETARRVECAGVADWGPALAEMQRLLKDEAGRAADAFVVISDHWSKYAMVPWSDEVSGGKERLAHARICLGQVYGGAAEGWQVCVADAVPGEPAVASAVPAALLDGIRNAVEAAGHRLVSARPQLVDAHDRWRDRLPEAGGWFVTLDDGSLAGARLARDGWDRVYAARVGTDWMVERQRLRAYGRLVVRSGESARVYVDAPAWLRELAGDCGPDVEWLADAAGTGAAESDSPAARGRAA